MAVTNEINRVKFVSEDFETYRQEAKEYFFQNYPDDFNNLLATDLGNAIIDQIAFAMQALTFTINRRASELFLETARLNKSITKLARMLGYPIRPASPAQATTTMVFTDAPFAFPVSIPVGFQFETTSDTIYEYRGTNPLVLLAGQTTLTTTLKEGKTKTLVVKSNGQPNQQFNIPGVPNDQYLYADSMKVLVDGVEWSRIDIIKYEGSQVYEVLFTDDPPKLRFGDGIAGAIPPEGAEIAMSYVFGKGRLGAVGSDQITGFVAPLVIQGIDMDATVTNLVSTVGDNPEDIRSVKAFASAFFRTQNAAVIKEDYDTIAKLQQGVALADAQTLRGISGDLVLIDYFADIESASNIVSGAAALIEQTGVSGLGYIALSGVDAVGVSGMSGLYVGGISSLGVSGIDMLGVNVSGQITGLQYLGVSGTSALIVDGQAGVGVSGVDVVGVSGISYAGVSGQSEIYETAVSGLGLINDAVSGVNSYLSQIMSDTCRANHVQVVILSVDANNRYISPTNQIITDVESKLQSMCDAVVTINVVDGSPLIVTADILVDIKISDTAVEADVYQATYDALAKSDNPAGLLIRRDAGKNLYKSEIYNAVRDANDTVDIRFLNVSITSPTNLLDVNGNLIIKKQQVIQDGVITIKIERESEFLAGRQ